MRGFLDNVVCIILFAIIIPGLRASGTSRFGCAESRVRNLYFSLPSIHKQSIRIYRRIRQTRRTVGHESEFLCIRCMRWHYNVLYYNGFPDSYPFWAGVWRRYLICWKFTSGFRPYNAEYVSLHFVVHSLEYLRLFNITCNKDIEEEHIYDIL